MQIPDYISASYIKNCYKNTSLSKSKSSKKLASGYRINTAADDAAKLSISEKMRAQIRGLDQASNNIQDSISFLQVADGALETASAITQRIRELAVQAANDTYTNQDRAQIQQECDQLQEEMLSIFDCTAFHSKQIFSKDFDLDKLSSEDISGLLLNKHMPIFNSDQMIEGSSKEIPAKILNLISHVLRMRVVIKDILETSEKSATGELKIDHDRKLAIVAYGAELLGYAEDLAEYINHFTEAEYKQYLVPPKRDIKNFLIKEKKGEDAPKLLNDAIARIGPIYFAGGARDNLTCNYLSCVMNIFKMAQGTGTSPDSRDINSMWDDLNNTAKTNLQGTTLIQLLLRKDYDSAYKTLWKLANSGNENKKEPFSFQIGANASNALQLQINIPVGLWSSPSFTLISSKGAARSIKQADQFMGHITTLRSEIGAYQNRLESALANAEQSAESLQDAESRMRDANMAKETADYLKTKLQNEFQQSFLAQKNASSMDLSVLSFPAGK